MSDTRLIESAFPLRQVSRASVHEKSVRHGHVSTLHVWPARRPLAASRAAVLAALLPAPGDEDARRRLLARMAAILPWGGEDPAELARFRAEVRAAFGGRAPRVLDPFAGGGAIPLEAMRLGCAAEAADLNPVAWFLLRCTLHWPRALAGARRPLPGFALQERAFAEAFLKAQGVTGEGGAARGARPAGPRRRRGGATDGAPSGAAVAGGGGGRGVASAGVGAAGAGAGAARPGGAVSDVRGVRAAPPQGAQAGRAGAAGAAPPARPAAARAGRGGARVGGGAQRGVRLVLPGAGRQPALGGEAGGGVPVGADGAMPRLPGGDPAAEDRLAVPEGREAGGAEDDAGRRRRGRGDRRRDVGGRGGRFGAVPDG